MYRKLEIIIKGKAQSRGGVQNRSVATRDTYQRGKMALRSRAILPKKIMPKQYEIYSMYDNRPWPTKRLQGKVKLS